MHERRHAMRHRHQDPGKTHDPLKRLGEHNSLSMQDIQRACFYEWTEWRSFQLDSLRPTMVNYSISSVRMASMTMVQSSP